MRITRTRTAPRVSAVDRTPVVREEPTAWKGPEATVLKPRDLGAEAAADEARLVWQYLHRVRYDGTDTDDEVNAGLRRELAEMLLGRLLPARTPSVASSLAPCGTRAAYRRHLKNEEPIDAACRAAAGDSWQQWRERRDADS